MSELLIENDSYPEIELSRNNSNYELCQLIGKLWEAPSIPCYLEAEGISGPTVRYKHTDFIAFMHAVTIC